LRGSAAVAVVFPTPAQVIMRGSFGSSKGLVLDGTAPGSAGPYAETASLSTDLVNTSFLELAVTLPPAPETTQPAEPRREPSPAEISAAQDEPGRLVVADEFLRDPLDGDFLDAVNRALAGPLPPSEGPSLGEVAPGDLQPVASLDSEGGGGSSSSADAGSSTSMSGSGDAGGPTKLPDPLATPGLGQSAAANAVPLPGNAAGLPPGFVLPAPPAGAAAASLGTPAAAPGTPGPGSSTAEAPAVTVVDAAPVVSPPAPPTLVPDFAKLDLGFEPNRGQAAAGVAYLAHGPGYGIALTPDGVSLALPAAAATQPAAADRVHLHFAGATPDSTLQGTDLLPGTSNYFRAGAQPLHLTDVPTFAAVTQDLGAGLSVVYHGNGPNLQFDFHVSPGTDPAAVRIAYEGARDATVEAQGQLTLHLASGQALVVQAPVLYQTAADGTRQSVAGGYVVQDDGSIGFHVGPYDPSRELVLDPTLSLSSYLGGSNTDNGNAIAVDGAGDIYLVGGTSSANFPTANAYDSTLATGMGDAFLTKVSASGVILFSTYLGGVNLTQNEAGLAVAVDAAGSAYLTGQAGSSDFPTTSGAYQTSLSGTSDAFVTKFAPAGNALVFSTLLGGSSTESGRAIGVAADDSVFVAGQTASTNFPTASPAQSSNGGGNDGFVTKLKPDGSGLVFSTYAGGSGTDDLRGLAVDTSGRVVVVGTTASTGLGTSGAYQTSLSGTQDILVRRYTAAGALDWSSYLGGSGTEWGNAVGLDSSGHVYVAGFTQSSGLATSGAYQTALSGGQDALVAQLSADGSTLGWLSYLGGGNTEEATGLGVDLSANVYVAGLTNSQSPSGFPTSNAVQSSYGGSTHDAFITAFNAGGASVAWSTYLGGNGDDTAAGLALDLDNNVYVTGSTASGNLTTVSPFQGTLGGGTDAFLAKLLTVPPPPVFTSISDDTGSSATDQITTDQTLSISGTAEANKTVTVYRADVGQIGTTTADGSGNWTLNYTGTTLPEGTYAFTAIETSGSVVPV
jgi:hypothetical protein